jgi:hypothetical protein
MGVPTHVMVYSGELAVTMGNGSGPLQFLGPLGQLNGSERWYILFYALPPGKDYEDLAGHARDYLQAAGESTAMTVEICKPAGQQWGVERVRYVIGRPHRGDEPLDVAIKPHDGTQLVGGSEVFDADEAAQLFMTYYRTGDIPAGYVWRPVEGYAEDGGLVDLRGASA